jgi:hypothetical protein
LIAAAAAAMLSVLIVMTRLGGCRDKEPPVVCPPRERISVKDTPKVARHLAIKGLGPPLTPGEIEAFEREIGGRLPDDYKEFMLAHNGGLADPPLAIMWNGDLETLPSFDPLMPATVDHDGLRRSLQKLRELNRATTKGFLPIASTFGGDYVCLAVRGKVGAVFHTVYTYKTVYQSDLVPVDVSMAPLADSFTEFLDSLTEIHEPYCRIEDLGQRGTPEDLAKFLAEGNSINAVGRNKLTVVCRAITFDNLPMIRACIQHGASLSGTVRAAAQARQTHLIRMLVQAGADINERDEFGCTPLYYVGGTALPGEEGAKNRELYDLLVKLGAVGGRL